MGSNARLLHANHQSSVIANGTPLGIDRCEDWRMPDAGGIGRVHYIRPKLGMTRDKADICLLPKEQQPKGMTP